MRLIVKIITQLILVAGLFFLLLNFQYFSKQVHLFFSKKEDIEVAKNLDSREREIKNFPASSIIISSLNIQAPIQEPEAVTEEAFQKAIEKGVGHFPGTAQAGEVGNMYLFAHSSDLFWNKGDYKTIFSLLPDIQLNSEIIITDANGEKNIYVVKDRFVVFPKDLSVLSQETEGKKILTLQTSYPVGTALKRYIVRAELLEK